MTSPVISHALVLPDQNFSAWLEAARPFTQKFERVAIVRSPAGNDLNRYRNVSAVNAPLTWFQDDPLLHIQRIYPMVVRVDLIQARTPQELAAALDQRIRENDRYGEKRNSPRHIFDRFILEWPTQHRPLQMTRRFNPAPGPEIPGIDVLTRPGTSVLAAAPGIVTRLWPNEHNDVFEIGSYVQVTTLHEGQTYVVSYAGVRKVRVTVGATVKVGDVLAEASSERLSLVVQNLGRGLPGFRLQDIIDPAPLIYLQDIRVRPTAQYLRVRTIPSVDGEILGRINPWDTLEVLEGHGRVLGKIGVENEWVRIKLLDGRRGYAAAWFLQAVIRSDRGFFGVNPVGVNLDATFPRGAPPPAALGGLGWVRFGYRVSMSTGSEDIQAAFNRYLPLAEAYKKAGLKVLFTTSHETYGEAKGFPPWPNMGDEDWTRLIQRFAEMMARIAKQWAGRGLVDAWQVWNEQDAPIGAQASVPMSARNYTRMLTQLIPAIRANDGEVLVLTGGHTGGPLRGGAYARESIQGLPSDLRPDGVACHPYGRGPQPGEPYAIFGHIDDEVQAFASVMPDKPIWITEWGVLDRPNDDPAQILAYASSFVNHLKGRYVGQIAAIIWYAWVQGMHNGYGVVDASGNPRPPFTSSFLKL